MPLGPGISAMPGLLSPAAAISAYPFGLTSALGMPFTLPFPQRKPAAPAETTSLANDDSGAADDDDDSSNVDTVGGDDPK